MKYLVPAFWLAFIFSCTSIDIDDEKPYIDLNYTQAFPINCDTLYFGESFIFKARFTDNVELGSYSIEIHHNFDHHSHSTEVSECHLSDPKPAINPFLYIEEFEIPPEQSEYLPEITIELPEGNENGAFDEGDYHFLIRLSDREGWSDMRGVGVKVVYRD